MDRLGGLVTLTAAPAALKDYAGYIFTLGDHHHRGMAYAEVDWPNGEVQVFRDYGRRVSAARVARREVLAERGDRPGRDTLNRLIWERGTDVRHHRRRRPVVTVEPDQPPVAANDRWPLPTPYGRVDPAPKSA